MYQGTEKYMTDQGICLPMLYVCILWWILIFSDTELVAFSFFNNLLIWVKDKSWCFVRTVVHERRLRINYMLFISKCVFKSGNCLSESLQSQKSIKHVCEFGLIMNSDTALHITREKVSGSLMCWVESEAGIFFPKL